MTFKDLKKRVTLESTQQQCWLFDRLQNKQFWIWNIEEHKREDVRTNGYCCFNHIVGLPQKNGIDKPLYDYEKMIFDSLILPSFDPQISNTSSKKYLWIKKATGCVIPAFGGLPHQCQ